MSTWESNVINRRVQAYLANPTMPREKFKTQLLAQRNTNVWRILTNAYYRKLIKPLPEDPYEGKLRKDAKTKANKEFKTNLKRSNAFKSGKLLKIRSTPSKNTNAVLFDTRKSPLDDEEEETYIN